MKNLNKVAKYIFAIIWLLLGSNALAYDFQVDDKLFFSVISTGDLTCRLDSVSADYDGTLIIPEKVSWRGRELTTKSIGSQCISSCTKLKSIHVPQSVANLEAKCFANCKSLESADLTSLTTVTLPSYMFRNCRSLKSVLLPTTMQSLPTGIFEGCIGLNSVEIPSCVTTLEDSCFHGCGGLSDLKIPEGVTMIGNYCFTEADIKSISLPSTLQSIGNGAFARANVNSPLNLPKGLNSLGDSCFTRVSIPALTIPASVNLIGDACFYASCIPSIKFADESPITILGDAMFYNSSIKEIVLPSGLEEIGRRCFTSCHELKELRLPETIRRIGKYSLSDLNLDTFTLPDSIESVEERSFNGDRGDDDSANPIPASKIKHFVWKAVNLNEKLYEEAMNSYAPTEIRYSLNGPYRKLRGHSFTLSVDTFEIAKTCDILYLGWFSYYSRSFDIWNDISVDLLFHTPLFSDDVKSLIIDDSEIPLRLLSPVIEVSYTYGTYRLAFCNLDDARTYYKEVRKHLSQWEIIQETYTKDYISSWVKSLEDLYLGRDIEGGNPLFLPNLRRLKIGQVKEVKVSDLSQSPLEIIECTSAIPPIISGSNFSKSQYFDLLVVVPDDAIDAYRNADVWKDFWNLTTKSEYIAGVKDVVSSDKEKTVVSRYDCSGKEVTPDYSGIVIVRYSDGSVKKMIQ